MKTRNVTFFRHKTAEEKTYSIYRMIMFPAQVEVRTHQQQLWPH